MTKREVDMISELKENMRGGDGQVELIHAFNKEDFTGKCRLFAKITIGPGSSIGPHVHDAEEEVYYIISGIATANDNGTMVTLYPGDALKTGGGEHHAISNNGDEPLVFIAVILLF